MPTLVLDNRSPFDCLFQRSPNYHFLHTFGCLCFPFLRPYNNHKLDFRSSPCVFFGYSPSHLCYRCFDIESHRMYISRHVRFHEHVFAFDKFEQIVQVSTQTNTPSPITILPNLTHSPCSPFKTHPIPPLLLPCPHCRSKHHSFHISLAAHHMHLYLTILLQVQVAAQCFLLSSTRSLIVVRHPMVPPLLLFILPVTWFLQTLPLLPALHLRQFLPRFLPLV